MGGEDLLPEVDTDDDGVTEERILVRSGRSFQSTGSRVVSLCTNHQ